MELEATEGAALGMDTSEWMSYVWDDTLIHDRGFGVIKTEKELMERIFALIPREISDEQKQAVTEAHRERLRRSLSEIPEDVLATVRDLKNMGFKLGVISNADVTDTANWGSSPLRPYFDSAVFSCDIGSEKPDRKIYPWITWACPRRSPST